jgi:subtilisin family serine protease/subtilisin-like proprotein convertase family protein
MLGALSVWMASRPSPTPQTPGGHPDTGGEIALQKNKAATALAATPSSSAADNVFSLSEGGAQKTYAVALDELYFPGSPTDRRLERITAQADLPSLLKHATDLARHTPEGAPRLVLYPLGGPRDARTRRIVNPRVEVVLASADAPSPPPRPDLGIASWERPAYAPNHAIAYITGDAAQPLRAALAAASLPGIRSARPLLARQRFPRRTLNDPMLKSQWHLGEIRAAPAWDSSTGSGIVIGIVDNGVDLSHPDLSPALDNSLGYDWNDNDNDPSAEDHDIVFDGETYPREDDHGTAVAGLAAARGDNRIGGAGSAPSATLAAMRLIAAPTDDSEEAGAMYWRNDVISVKNNSWGPYDYYPDVSPAPSLWLSAVAEGASNGRDGLGVLYFWAAGNGQSHGDQGSLDGYASARPVIAVAATGKGGSPAGFSEGGPHVVVAAPGAGGIVTTDRVGSPGYTRGSYTSGFSGTSAATPIAAGVGALLLEGRPDLGWRDIKEILLRSSSRALSTSGDWTSRPAGDPAHPIKHHPRLGGGLVNALSALTLARNWRPLGPETEVVAFTNTPGSVLIPDNPALPLSLTFEMPDDSPVLRVEHVVVNVNITHSFRGDLEITLVSPSGTTSRFTKTNRRMSGEDYVDYPFTSVRHWGEESHLPDSPSKRWTLRIRDTQAADSGSLNSATLTLYGTPLAPPAVVTPLAGQTLATGSTLVLRGDFSGGNLSYVWRRDGQVIPGADAPEYRLANFSAKHAGVYTCTATNALDTASSEAQVTLDDSPRGSFDFRASTSTELDLAGYVDGEVALWKATSLPAGLRLDPLTGLLTGRPTKPGAYPFVVTATKRDGAVARLPLLINISPLPAPLAGRHVMGVGIDAEGSIDFERKGLLTLTVSANGRATGLLHSGTGLRSFSVVLDETETDGASFVYNFTASGATRRLTVNIAPDGESSGTFEETAPGIFMPITGHSSPWDAKSRPATDYASRFTAVFGQGSGDVSRMKRCLLELNVGPDGVAKWRLLPSDGSPALTGSSPLGEEGQLLFFAPYAKQNGAIFGEFALPAAPLQELASDISLRWDRAPAPTWLEPAGFYNQKLSVLGGGRYSPPASGQRLLGYTVGGAPLEIGGDPVDFPYPLAVGVTVDAANKFVVPAPNQRKFQLTTKTATGWVTGSYRGTIPHATNPDEVREVLTQFAGLVLNTKGQVSGFDLSPHLGDGSSRYCRAVAIRPEQPAD